MWNLEIAVDDVRGAEIARFLNDHVEQLRLISPPESCHVLDLDGLRGPEVTVWTARIGDEIVGTSALQMLDARHGEVKSMRTGVEWLGRGIASALLGHLMSEARSVGCQRLSLETGAQPYFAPARRLYARHGFSECPPFGAYHADPLSVFMTVGLIARPGSS